MEGSKIQLSSAELQMACDAGIILTKNKIIEKVISMMDGLQLPMTAHSSGELYKVPPKISRGENYRGLPWVVLDYPRVSTPEGLCFVRTLFWWGNFFSSTVQLSGIYQQRFGTGIGERYEVLARENWYAGVNQDPWQHHFEASNYQPVGNFSRAAFAGLLAELPHIKIAARWPLEEWNGAATLLWERWRFLQSLVS